MTSSSRAALLACNILGAPRLAAGYAGADTWTTWTSTTETQGTTIDASSLRDVEAPSWWPTEWGLVQWTAVLAPLSILLAILIFLYARRRIRTWGVDKRRKMKVAPMPFEVAPGKTTTATRWDFAQMGALVPSDIKMAEEVLTTAERDAKALGRPLPKCVLAFSAENLRLGAELVDKVGVLLSGHPTTSLEMSNDWSHATNEALMSLAALLSRNRPERCRIRAPPDEHADADGGKNPGALNKLRLAGGASAAALEAVSEALASAAHSEVDSIVVEPGKNATKSEKGKVRELALGPLRLTSQELTLSRTGIGDIGCVAACGFMRPFAGRLQIARLMECELHDDGALAVARLLRGLSADTTARKGAEGYTVVGPPERAHAHCQFRWRQRRRGARGSTAKVRLA